MGHCPLRDAVTKETGGSCVLMSRERRNTCNTVVCVYVRARGGLTQ